MFLRSIATAISTVTNLVIKKSTGHWQISSPTCGGSRYLKGPEFQSREPDPISPQGAYRLEIIKSGAYNLQSISALRRKGSGSRD